MTDPVDDLAQRRIRNAIEGALVEIRATGATVTILKDVTIAVLVEVVPQPTYPCGDDGWAKVSAATLMWIDPADAVVPTLREMAAEEGRGRKIACYRGGWRGPA